MKTAFNNLKSNVIFLLLCGLTMLLLARGTLYALPEVLWALGAVSLNYSGKIRKPVVVPPY